MVTLSWCLIWQIISFILPTNEYGCVYAWTTFGRGPAIDLQKITILVKKNSIKQNKVNVWCGFWSRGIIGLFFFENDQGEAATLSGDRYRAMLNENCRRGYWQHLVSTGRRYVPHSRSYTRCFVPCFWRSHYRPQSCYRLATSKLWFDTVGVLFVGCRQR